MTPTELAAWERPSARISPCGRYRYTLERFISDAPGVLVWLMLNPSTADATKDDPTIRKCGGFTQRAGYGGMVVVNLFAFRATDPRACRDAPDRVGPENDEAIFQASQLGPIVCAWGAQPWARGRAVRVIDWLSEVADPYPTLLCIDRAKDGDPVHPLMQPYAKKLRPFAMLAEWRKRKGEGDGDE